MRALLWAAILVILFALFACAIEMVGAEAQGDTLAGRAARDVATDACSKAGGRFDWRHGECQLPGQWVGTGSAAADLPAEIAKLKRRLGALEAQTKE